MVEGDIQKGHAVRSSLSGRSTAGGIRPFQKAESQRQEETGVRAVGGWGGEEHIAGEPKSGWKSLP